MLQLIRQWLHGGQDYHTGVIIYRKLENKNQHLLALIAQPPTDFSGSKLREALAAAYATLQAQQHVNPETAGIAVKSVILKPAEAVAPVATETTVEPKNSELWLAAKTDADNAFKSVMNARAILFRMAAYDGCTDPNLPDRIAERRGLAIQIVEDYKAASALYDRADHVLATGKLPDQDLEETEEEDLSLIPDHLVKQRLDNLRKNYSKTKKKQPTAERVMRLQIMEKQIKILEERWHSLK